MERMIKSIWIISVRVPQEIDSEIRIQVQVVCLGGDPRKHQLKSGEVRQRREGELSKQVLLGQLGLNPPGSSVRLWKNRNLSYPTVG